jgi:cyclopropane fatty-acyl-phospholipid synthase-like methyltransferase
MSRSLDAEGWNARYGLGEYIDDPPLPFVDKILEDLGESGREKFGLYVGCGNGRNFIPLLKSGLNLRGIDISQVGIDQLLERCPEAEGRLRATDFEAVRAARVFDYLVAIQVFQHGDTRDVSTNFRQAHDVLKPSGRLFLRINSASTQVVLRHHQTENNKYGGFTIVYDEGEKQGGKRHFFTHQELEVIAATNGFDIQGPMVEVSETRKVPKTGTWSQWETIWQKV